MPHRGFGDWMARTCGPGHLTSVVMFGSRTKRIVATVCLISASVTGCTSEMDRLRGSDPAEAADIAGMCAAMQYPITLTTANGGLLRLESRSECEEIFAGTENVLREARRMADGQP